MPASRSSATATSSGVVAPDEPTAARALAAIRAEWKTAAAPCSDKDLFDYLKKNPGEAGGGGGPSAGRAVRSRRAWRRPTVKVEQTYTIAYIAHAPLEPRAAVAEWEGDKLTVWTGTQRPFGVRAELAQALRHSRGPRPRDRARHGRRLRRQAHRRGGRRGGPAGARRRAGRSSWSGRVKRSSPGPTSAPPGVIEVDRRRRARTARSRPGSSTTTTPAARASRRPTTCPIAPVAFHAAPLAAAAGVVPGPGVDGQPLRARVARWTSWPAASGWTRSRSASRTSRTSGCGPSSRPPRSGSAGARPKPGPDRGFGHRRAGPRRGATWPPAPRSPSTAPAAR